MSGKTLTRSELCDALSEKLNISRQKGNQVLESILENMALGLEKEGKLKLSSFGTFTVRPKKTRTGRNPKTGKEVPILPHNAILYRASYSFKGRVMTGH